MKKKILITFIALLFQYIGYGQIYNMTNTTINTCSGTFFDPGGASASYGNNANFTMTFCSSTPGQQIFFTFTAFQTEANFDYLYIYNGPSTASPLIGTYNGTTSPGTVSSTSGCLTFRFTSDGSVVYSGWTAQIGCGSPPPPPPAPPTALCSTAQPFCTGTTINFPAGTNNGNAFPNSYGCLGTSPNPAWYYLQIQNPGNLDITMQSSPLVDIDFILWGPFPNISSMCTSYSTGNVVDCSYSTSAIEYANIVGATTGQVYLLLITNYSNTTCNISFNQTGGAATTNCNILCNMTGLTATPSACNPVTNTYSVTGQVTFQYPPPTGNFTISSSCGGTPVSIPSNITIASPYTYTINNIPAMGTACTVTAGFSADPTCNKTQSYTAPPSCNCGLMTSNSTTPVSCIGLSDGTATVSVSNAIGIPTYSWANNGANTNSISGLAAGTYTCYIADPGVANCNTIVNVTVGTTVDATPPSIIACPTDIHTVTDSGTCGATVSWTAPTTTDNCSATISQTAGILNGNIFPLGTSLVTYTAQDLAGNTATCSFNVIVQDTTSPIISNCPSNITTSNNPAICGAIVNWTAPTVSDNCSAVMNQIQGPPNGGNFPLGTTTVSYLAQDPSGNTTTCSFSVTVNDTENPTITNCPANIVTVNDVGQCGAIVTWLTPTPNDNCPGVSISQTQGAMSGSLFPLGTSNIQYIATDAAGLTDTCSFSITITDTEAPIISNCPANITTNSDVGQCGAIVNWISPTVVDNCPNATIVQTAGFASGTLFPLGTSTITYTATDASGNTDSCTFTISITDNESPLISNCPSNIVQNNDIGICGATISWLLPTVSDNCPNVSLVQTQGLPSGSLFPLGLSTIEYIATDAVGLTDTCTFTINISDTELPVIVSCPNNITQTNDIGVCGATVTWAAPTTTDNCPNPTIVQTVGLASGAIFPLGTSTIEYVATDANGNTDTCSFTITVTDTELPQIVNCPANISQINDVGNCGAVITWIAPTTTDNCPNPSITQIAGLPSGSIFPLGTSTVTYVATDANGNSDTCSFTITITDTEAPVFITCPSNQILNNTIGKCGAYAGWQTPTATDNCSGLTITQTSGLASGSLFSTGVSVITYIATDAAGNTDTCSFTITISDTEPPILTNCPTNIDQDNDLNQCSAVVTWIQPLASDNCPGVVLSSTHSPGMVFPLGTTTVTYIATDIQGLTDTCSFTVTIKDTQAPSISNCPANQTLSADANCQGIATWTNPTVSDNCPNVNMIANYGSGAAFPLGTTTVNYIAIDGAGLTDTCSFTITVQDITPPLISNCPANIVHNVGANCNHAVTWTVPTVTDNCSGVSMTANYNSGDSFPFGLTTVTYIATDAVGLHDTCTFTINVIDNTPPLITNCPSNIVLNLHTSCDTVVNWVEPSATDNCPGVTMLSNVNTGTTFAIGTTTITYIATDAAGLKDTCSFTVTINPPSPINANISSLQNPNCVGGIGSAMVNVTGGSGSYTYTWSSVPNQYGALAQLTAGNYIVTIKDYFASACVALDTLHVQIVNPPVLGLNMSKTNPTCFGLSNGSANGIVTGGTAPYSYNWSTTPPQFTANANNLPAGTYTLNIIDAGGCTIAKSITLTEPDSLQGVVSQEDVKCFGAATGKASIIATKGTPPYQFAWTNSPSTAAIATNLLAGSYTVTVTDANNCSINRTYVITEPASALSVSTTTKDALCFGTKTGSATAIATGGTPNYTYTWQGSPIQYQANASNLAAGNHTFVVKDAHNCIVTGSVTIVQPPRLDVNIQSIIQPYCDSLNGAVEVISIGGTSPYTYSWKATPAQQGALLSQVGEGTYQCIATDANGCRDSLSVVLKNTPPAQAAFASTPANTEPIVLTQANIHFDNLSQGGVAYSWNFGDGYSSSATNPSHVFNETGTYNVSLTAFNAYYVCPTEYVQTYIIIPNGTIYEPNSFSPNGDGVNDVFQFSGEGIKTLECDIYNRWGILIYRLQSISDKWEGKDQNGIDVPEGAYVYKINVLLNDGTRLQRGGTITVLR